VLPKVIITIGALSLVMAVMFVAAYSPAQDPGTQNEVVAAEDATATLRGERGVKSRAPTAPTVHDDADRAKDGDERLKWVEGYEFPLITVEASGVEPFLFRYVIPGNQVGLMTVLNKAPSEEEIDAIIAVHRNVREGVYVTDRQINLLARAYVSENEFYGWSA
jgi:hypothetical protein